MSYSDVAKELKKNIQVMTNTFEQNNLQIINLTCRPLSKDDHDLQVLIEIASIEGASIPHNLDINLNLYEDNGELYMCNGSLLFREKFDGYDTCVIGFFDDSRVLDIATKGRLYVTRW